MPWNGLRITVDGRNALNQAQVDNKIAIKSIVVGDGRSPGNFNTMKGLVHQLYEITEIQVDVQGNTCTITADFPQVDYDYYFREIGVIVRTDSGDKLYVYDNCGDDAQYIVTTTGIEKTRKRIRLLLTISDVNEITAVTPEILYVTYDDFEKLEKKVDQQSRVTFVTLTAAGWEGDAAPFAQTVTVDEAREELEALLVSALEDGASLETQKAYTKAYGIICSGTAALGDGTATFKVYKKPAVDITVGLKGV